MFSFTWRPPEGYIVQPFTEFDSLEISMQRVLLQLQDTGDGNQWIILVGLPSSAIERMIDKFDCLGGFHYCFQWEESIGLLKMVPESCHAAANHIVRAIDHQVSLRTNPPSGALWTSTAMYNFDGTKSKQSDQAFLPSSRYSPQSQTYTLASLVIETGVAQSLPRLREHAK
jgi:hypothetical protein